MFDVRVLPADGAPMWSSDPVVLRRHPARRTARRTALLLHGLGNSATVWDQTVPLWPDDVEVYAAELPWRGNGPDDWSHDPRTPTEAVVRAVEAVPGGVDLLVAHSLSANIVMDLFCGKEPHPFGTDVRALALVSPFYRAEPTAFEWAAIPGMMAKFEETTRHGIVFHTKRPLSEDVLREIVRKVCDRVGPYGWLRFFDIYLRTPWLRAGELGVPCTVFSGSKDVIVSMDEGRELAARVLDCPFQTLDCGHFPMLERPAELTAAVLPLLPELIRTESP